MDVRKEERLRKRQLKEVELGSELDNAVTVSYKNYLCVNKNLIYTLK